MRLLGRWSGQTYHGKKRNAVLGVHLPSRGHHVDRRRHLQFVNCSVPEGKAVGVSVCLTEVVGREDLILQRVLRTNGDNGFMGVEGTEAASALACLLAPLHLFFQHVEQCHDVAETAAGREERNLRLDQSCRYPGFFMTIHTYL